MYDKQGFILMEALFSLFIIGIAILLCVSVTQSYVAAKKQEEGLLQNEEIKAIYEFE